MRLETATADSEPTIDASEFVTTLQHPLKQGNIEEALKQVQGRWTVPQIITLLKDGSGDVRKIACLALSLIGDKSAIQPLAIALHDADAMVSQMAEHALWSIWFKIGKCKAVRLVECGNQHMHHGNYPCAIEKFSQAIQEDPQFAEAYNQRAIAHYLNERYTESIEDCKAALALMPQHFGAMSGMGHCHAHLGEIRGARQCYRLALAIHPRLEGIECSLEQIEQLLRENPGH